MECYCKKWEDITVNIVINPGSFVKTEKESEAIIAFGNVSAKKSAAVITLVENTVIQISVSLFDKSHMKAIKINVPLGKVWSAVEKLQDKEVKFEIETPNALAGVRGTVFMVGYSREENSSKISVIQGEVGVLSKFAAGLVILREKYVNCGHSEQATCSSAGS